MINCKSLQYESSYVGIASKGQGTTICDISNLKIPDGSAIKGVIIQENTAGLHCTGDLYNSTNTEVKIIITNNNDSDFYGMIYH